MDSALSIEVSQILDRVKCSDRSAVRILAESYKLSGRDLSDVSMSYSTIRRFRIKTRKLYDVENCDKFKPSEKLTIQFDGKLMSNIDNKWVKVERLPIIVAGIKVNKLLEVPKVMSGTGANVCECVAKAIAEWDIHTQVIAACFDTCSVNTGRINGVLTLLETKLKKELLCCACRHHMRELLVGAAFEEVFGKSTAPEVSLFKYFRKVWKDIDQTDFKVGFDTDLVSEETAADIAKFCQKLLQMKHVRADYKELLDLTLMCLGKYEGTYKFKVPGAMHHARWMSKAIYILKMYLFRHQLILLETEREQIRNFCQFLIHIHVQAWFLAPLVAAAPSQDLNLLRQLEAYKSINKGIAKACLLKHKLHLWYLSEKLVCLAIFDSNVTRETKQDLATAILTTTVPENKLKRIVVEDVEGVELAGLVTEGSIKFFRLLDIPTEFLSTDPASWPENPDYQRGLELVMNLQVVNDGAERGVSLASEYNMILTKNEAQQQCLLRQVHDHRQKYPSCSKSKL